MIAYKNPMFPWLFQKDQQKIAGPSGATYGDFQWMAAWKDVGSCEACRWMVGFSVGLFDGDYTGW